MFYWGEKKLKQYKNKGKMYGLKENILELKFYYNFFFIEIFLKNKWKCLEI